MTMITAPNRISAKNVPDGLINFWGHTTAAMCRVDPSLTLAERWASRPTTVTDRPQPQWLQPTIRRMLDLPWDDDNWNDDAKRTDPGAAADLLILLTSILDAAAPTPSIVPTWRGGVQAEWHRNGVNLEIEVDPTEPSEYYFLSSTEEYEEPVDGNVEKLIGLASRLSPHQQSGD